MTRRIRFDSWTSARDLRADDGGWTSPEVDAGFGFTDLVASWNARTPVGTWIEVGVQVVTVDGERTPWFVMGRWAETDDVIAPTSVTGQAGRHGEVQVDRLVLAEGVRGAAYRMRVVFHRAPGCAATPEVTLLGCVVSEGGGQCGAADAPYTLDRPVLVDVPTYSQQLHRGSHPQWAGGGESWCSPTSTSMVLAHWGLAPDPADYAWVEPHLPDRFVTYAARHTFDHAYNGPGNWSFNAAYAARFGAVAFVTRLRSLTEAERFLEAGIPLVVAVSFTRAELTGAGYDTPGHLLVVVGFDAEGNVVCNDPASHRLRSNDEVRTTYDRAEFSRAWQCGSAGLAYVIRPPDVPLPVPPAEPNW